MQKSACLWPVRVRSGQDNSDLFEVMKQSEAYPGNDIQPKRHLSDRTFSPTPFHILSNSVKIRRLKSIIIQLLAQRLVLLISIMRANSRGLPF